MSYCGPGLTFNDLRLLDRPRSIVIYFLPHAWAVVAQLLQWLISGWTAGVGFQQGQGYFFLSASLLSSRYQGLFPRRYSSRGVKLTTHHTHSPIHHGVVLSYAQWLGIQNLMFLQFRTIQMFTFTYCLVYLSFTYLVLLVIASVLSLLKFARPPYWYHTKVIDCWFVYWLFQLHMWNLMAECLWMMNREKCGRIWSWHI
jgi:hypothetical protein